MTRFEDIRKDVYQDSDKDTFPIQLDFKGNYDGESTYKKNNILYYK
jgi:hypothetical protein